MRDLDYLTPVGAGLGSTLLTGWTTYSSV
jgi:hypothetical protein